MEDKNLRRKFLSGIITESTYKELSEQEPVVAGTPQTPQTPVQQTPTQEQPTNPQAEVAAEKNVEDAMAKVIGNLGAQLGYVAQSQGNKDGKLEVIPEYNSLSEDSEIELDFDAEENPFMDEKLDEGLALLGGLALSAPAILKGGSWLAGKLGKKVDSATLQKISTFLANKSDKLHHLYLGTIEKIIQKVYPGIDPKTNEKVSSILLTMLIAALAVDATSAASGALKAGEMAHAGAEGILASIKGSEVGAVIAKEIPDLMKAIGLFA
jgi:hypothetical protein